jgi:hypothetical protein
MLSKYAENEKDDVVGRINGKGILLLSTRRPASRGEAVLRAAR